jgi:hypothetical protein
MSPVTSTSLWDWWNLNVQKNNFEFLDGQVNGSSRQLKYQGDFRVNANQLDHDNPSFPVNDDLSSSTAWFNGFNGSLRFTSGVARASSTSTQSGAVYKRGILTQSQYAKATIKVDTDSDIGVWVNAIVGGKGPQGYVGIWSAARNQWEIDYADGTGGALTTLASNATAFTENFSSDTIVLERTGKVLNLYTGAGNTLRVTHTIGGGDANLLWGMPGMYIKAIGARTDVEIADVIVGTTFNAAAGAAADTHHLTQQTAQ